MKRIIKDYKTITSAQLALITAEYPDGFEIADLVSFKKPDGVEFRGLEIMSDDTLYLFKIDTKMLKAIDEQTDEDYDLDTFADSENYEFDNSEEPEEKEESEETEESEEKE
ncbi:MAG: TATA-binding protein-associated factor Taf7 [Flavobacteriales bacterium]|jgi:DNA-directed RNA polymerase subunit delta